MGPELQKHLLVLRQLSNGVGDITIRGIATTGSSSGSPLRSRVILAEVSELLGHFPTDGGDVLMAILHKEIVLLSQQYSLDFLAVQQSVGARRRDAASQVYDQPAAY